MHMKMLEVDRQQEINRKMNWISLKWKILNIKVKLKDQKLKLLFRMKRQIN